MADVTRPIDAATVLLLRKGEPLELFMVKRHGKSKFMGGVYVYPGGKRDDADSCDGIEQWCYGLTATQAAKILGHDIEPSRALGHFVAAVRETFEEAGVLLATNPDGSQPTLEPNAIQENRIALQQGTRTMAEVMQNLDLRMDLGGLRYFSHWITPPVEPRRFSARFFLCRQPEGQEARHDRTETTDGVWISPKQALEGYANGDFQSAPPTIRVLQEVARFETIESALKGAPHRALVPNAPRFVFDDGIACLVLPGDPLHPEEPGTTKQRFELRDKRWHVIID